MDILPVVVVTQVAEVASNYSQLLSLLFSNIYRESQINVIQLNTFSVPTSSGGI